jgi:PKD repeat protein
MGCVVLPDNSVLSIGGTASVSQKDAWRFQPSGSTEQNPTHTYSAGNWSVHLQVSNAIGYNNSAQNTWINVTSGVITPIVQWILDKSTVRVPGTVTVNDTSLNTPTAWQYFWGDGTSNTTTNNATHKYVKRGVYQVTLNATNSAGVNVSASKQVRVLGYEIYY